MRNLQSNPRSSLPKALLVIGIALLVYLLPLGVRPLVAPDELRYAAIPAEMLAEGDWVVPSMAGMRYFEKPAGGYWLVAISTSVFGDTPFAQRLPGALSALLSAVMVGWFVLVGTSRRDLAWLAAGVQLTTMGIVIISTANILDGPFAGLVTVSLVAYFIALESRGSYRVILLALAGLACGGAFLVKGLLAVVLPALVGGVYLICTKRHRELLKTPWLPIGVAAMVIAPWAIAIHRAEPEFWEHFIVGAHFNRFTAADANQHSEPFWYYLMMLPLLAIPWTFAWPLAALGLRGGERRRPWITYAACWIVAPFIFLSLSSGKLPTYLMPIMPPIAALCTVGLVRWFDQHPSRDGTARYIPAILLGLGALAVAIAPMVLTLETPLWDDGTSWRVYLFAGALMAWMAFEAVSVSSGRSGTSRLAWSIAAPVFLLAILPVVFPTGLMSNMKMPAGFLLKHREILQAHPVVTDERVGHGVAWVSGDLQMRLIGERGDFGSFPDDGGEEPARFIEPDALSGAFVFVLPGERLDRVLESNERMMVLERHDEDGLAIAHIRVAD